MVSAAPTRGQVEGARDTTHQRVTNTAAADLKVSTSQTARAKQSLQGDAPAKSPKQAGATGQQPRTVARPLASPLAIGSALNLSAHAAINLAQGSQAPAGASGEPGNDSWIPGAPANGTAGAQGMIQSESGRIYEVGDDPDPVAEANEQLGGAAQAAMDAALAFVRSPRAPGELRGHPAAEQRWIEPTAPGFGLSYPWVGQATGRGMSARAASSGESDVTIIVTDSVSNSPLANVDITAWLYDYATDDSTSTQVRTDAGGHAVLTGLAEGDLDIRVEDHVGSHVAAWDSNYLDGTSDITIPVALTPGGGVAGTISDAVTGDPVAGVCASLMAGHDPDGWTGAGGCSTSKATSRRRASRLAPTQSSSMMTTTQVGPGTSRTGTTRS